MRLLYDIWLVIIAFFFAPLATLKVLARWVGE